MKPGTLTQITLGVKFSTRVHVTVFPVVIANAYLLALCSGKLSVLSTNWEELAAAAAVVSQDADDRCR